MLHAKQMMRYQARYQNLAKQLIPTQTMEPTKKCHSSESFGSESLFPFRHLKYKTSALTSFPTRQNTNSNSSTTRSAMVCHFSVRLQRSRSYETNLIIRPTVVHVPRRTSFESTARCSRRLRNTGLRSQLGVAPSNHIAHLCLAFSPAILLPHEQACLLTHTLSHQEIRLLNAISAEHSPKPC